MKLTKLYIHNYKSFYDTTIELDKLNIIVGENNSGKSNLIDVLEFIDIAMSKDIERAIDDKGGYDKIKNYSAVGEEKVVVRATFEVNNDDFNDGFFSGRGCLLVSFSFTNKYSHLTCKVSIVSKNMNILDFILSKKQFFGQQMEKERLFIYPTLHENDKALIKESYLMLFNYFKVYFGLSTYYFDSHKIRDISHKNSRAVRLVKNGSNLGKILFSIKEENKNNFDLISNSLITTVQEIEGIEVEETFGNYLIGFKERNKKPIPIQTVSDGTINFLATMTALNEVDDGLLKESFLLVFEEPERHLHLNAVNYMLQAFRESDKQIIITTHSTEIIKYADLKEIVFIYRDSEGDTQSIRADAIPNLEQKMKRLAYERDVTLDELIAEGMMGTFE